MGETRKDEKKPEKVVTKYDRKVQRRKEQKEKDKRDKLVGTVIGVALLAALVCFVASFPIRSWLAVNGTYIRVDGEKVSRMEYDYHYTMASNNFVNANYSYLYYMGVDLSGDLSKQRYSDKLSWKDFFDQMAVNSIIQNKGMLKEAQAAGFTYDVAEDYKEYMENVRAAAVAAGVSEKDYMKQLFGPNATESRVKTFIEKTLLANAYYEQVSEQLAPAMEEVQEYYDSHKDDYDLVDYYLLTVDAELPTEPTELADPAGEEDTDAGEDGTEAAYEPSEAEIQAAMDVAREEAENSKDRIRVAGELQTGVGQYEMVAVLREWLFDGERKTGDVAVIEDTIYNRYYAVEFESRYLDETPSVDVRMAIVGRDNGQAVLDEWKGGAATEESFAEICEKYNDPAYAALDRGLYEALMPGSTNLPGEVTDWVGDSARKPGDTAVIEPAEGEDAYVLYYVASNEAQWILKIRQTLLDEALSEYLTGLTEGVDVEDPKGNLNYLKIQEAESQEPSDSEGESGESQESSDSEGESGESQESSDGEGEDTREPSGE